MQGLYYLKLNKVLSFLFLSWFSTMTLCERKTTPKTKVLSANICLIDLADKATDMSPHWGEKES